MYGSKVIHTSIRTPRNVVYPKTKQSMKRTKNSSSKTKPSPVKIYIPAMHQHQGKKNNRCLNSICSRRWLLYSLLTLLALVLLGVNAILISTAILGKATTTRISTSTTTTAISCSSSGSTTQAPGGQGGASVLYTFDNTSDDYFTNYDAVPINSPSYVQPGYNGRGYAIELHSNSFQYLTIANFLNFSQRSLTFEAWIYPFTISSINPDTDSAIFAQMNALTLNQFLLFALRNGRGFGAFCYNDVAGSTMTGTNQWYHIAFTYNYTTRTQIFYLNGIADGIHTNASPFLATNGVQAIGCTEHPSPSTFIEKYYDGRIDQLTILFHRAKSAKEILNDATLVGYYSMDCLSYSSRDSGPNQIDALANGLSSSGGRIGQSYIFDTASSYFQVSGLVLLGQSYRSFSFALWLRPIISVTNGGTILHVSQLENGLGWCVQFLGLNSLGQIIARTLSATVTFEIVGPVLQVEQWVHITLTHSRSNGLCLYINGILYGQSLPFIYATSGVPMTVTLGQPLKGSMCDHGGIQSGFYQGQIDEFYIYSRELSQADITILANP